MSEPAEPMQEIVEWLLTLRLSQYTLCFQQGGFQTLEDCKDLTDQSLLDLRVFPTGHRRRILRSLEALGVTQQSGDEDEEEEGVDKRGRRRPVPPPRNIFLKDKKRGTSCQQQQLKERDEYDMEGSQTLPPGVGLGLRPPQPAPRNPQNIQKSGCELPYIPPSASSISSSSCESLSISEMPSDWEVSSEDPSLSSTDSRSAEGPDSAFITDNGGFQGEMVENSIYESQPSFKAPAGPRLTRSYRLRHRPVPEIPAQSIPVLQTR